MTALIDLYFTRVNLFMPLLHRPTFDKGIAKGYHRQSSDFGGTVLLACAIGSRHSADPRVFLPGANSEHSAGWKWFDQVQMVRKARLAPPTIYDLQNYSVSIVTLSELQHSHHCTSCPSYFCKVHPSPKRPGRWWALVFEWPKTLVRTGERCIQLAPSSKMNYGSVHSGRLHTLLPYCYLLILPYRCLVTLDRYLSQILGRPCAIQDEE